MPDIMSTREGIIYLKNLCDLIQKQDEYIRLLEDWDRGTAPFLLAHGISCSPEMFTKGEILRLEIKQLNILINGK